MHIEPGIVDGAKIVLGYGTAAVSLGAAAWLAMGEVRRRGLVSLAGRGLLASLLVFVCIEVLPHYPVGVSEVHLLLGSTVFLFFGPAAAAIGLAAGLLAQGLLFVPTDLPQYGMNVTTLMMSLFGVMALAGRIITPNTAYVDLRYAQVFKLSAAFQGSIVLWVAFWAIYGRGFTAGNFAEITSFGAAYMTVVLIEPLINLAVLAAAKALRALHGSPLLERRLFAHG